MTPTGWVVIREGRRGRWGGELRRRAIFSRLAERTAATVVEAGWRSRSLRGAVAGPLATWLPDAVAAALAHGARPRLAASEKLHERLLRTAEALTDPAVVAVYDDPLAQARALGVHLQPEWRATVERRQRRNVDAFRWQVAPTASFARLAGLDPARTIIGGNGTDTDRIRPGPWPAEPVVGVVSGAAAGRGLETLVEAVRLAREQIAGLRLRMILVATGTSSEAYLADLRVSLGRASWASIVSAPYEALGAALAETSVLTIPHPANEYLDAALPVKLFDSMAAGRPIVVTPRMETAAIVRRHGVGVVAGGDAPADLASAIVDLLADEAQLRAMGAAARVVAESEYDWRFVGERIALEVLSREGEPAGA